MKRMCLNKGWKLMEVEPQSGLIEYMEKPNLNRQDWMKVSVPGDINRTLLDYNRIPDPYIDDNARSCYWVTSKEWWYYLSFDFTEDCGINTDLCLINVDGHADIWINDIYLGEMKNAFREHRFNVANKLLKGKNILLLRFKSIDQLLGGPRLDELGGWKGRRAYVRKPQFNFGWDWALPLPSQGLAGDVFLDIDNSHRFVDVSVRTFISGRVDFEFEVSGKVAYTEYDIKINISGYGIILEKTISTDPYRSYASFMITDPKLWYPNGQGSQALYSYSVQLVCDGKKADERQGKFGIREVKTVEEPFTPEAGSGYSFWFEVNGKKVFSKGGNWIPLELWPGIVKPEQYEFYLRRAKEANFNMLRVWGGGIYEADVFYKLCDELGIMVWQDFMFASTGYPVDTLRDEIIKEAQYQIKRLRNHPCIAVWCGINEDYRSWSWPEEDCDEAGQQDSGAYSEVDDLWKVDRIKDDPQIFSMILRGLVSKLGQAVPYVESSPESRDDYGNAPSSGNSHLSSWKLVLFDDNVKPHDFRKHFEQVCSFNSEFCIQGPCSINSLKRFLSPQNQWPPNDVWIYHIQRGHRLIPHYEQTLLIAGGIFGEINSLQKYVKYGQATHAEMMRAEFEACRRDYPNSGGTMMWMYNDCWPTANWSIIDYFREEKPSFFAAKRACTSLLPIVMERNGKIEFFFSNHSRKDIEVELIYGQENLAGDCLWSDQSRVSVPGGSAVKFAAYERNTMKTSSGDYLFIASAAEGVVLDKVLYFPDGWKDIEWPNPEVTLEIVGQKFEDGCWMTGIKCTTNRFARFVHIFHNDLQNKIKFSDNYFDMPANSEYRVVAYTEKPLSVEELQVGHWLTEWR